MIEKTDYDIQRVLQSKQRAPIRIIKTKSNIKIRLPFVNSVGRIGLYSLRASNPLLELQEQSQKLPGKINRIHRV